MRQKWRHHCRAKIGDKFALSLAKNSHLSFPPSHFPSLPSWRGHQRRKWHHHCRAKIGDKFALSLAKIRTYRFPLHTSRLSLHGEVTSMKHRKTRSNKYQKLLEIEKEIVREDAWVLKNWRKINCWAQTITRRSRYGFQQLIFFNFFNTHASSRTISFSISNSFWY